MSGFIFPSSLMGIGIGVKRIPVWSTMVQTSASGKETRASFQSSPRWRYEIPLNFARVLGFSAQTATNEMATIQAFYQSVLGKWDSFLYTDPYSNAAALTSFGTGTGLAGQTNQIKDIEGFPIYDLNGTPSLYVNGTLQVVTTNYTLSNGLVTWVTQPGAAATLTWSGAYYRRVRFDMDEFQMEQLCGLVWGNAVLKLISVK